VIDVAGLKASIPDPAHTQRLSDVASEIDRQYATLRALIAGIKDCREERPWERAQLLVNDLRRLTAKFAGLRP
jgi:hypothetical protein